MRRPPGDTIDEAGQDSFLDIVANIVGILIILVMVVGVRAKDVFIEQTTDSREAEPQPQIDVDSSRRRAAALGGEVKQLAHSAESLQHEALARYKDRGQLQTLVTAAEQLLLAKREELSGDEQEAFDLRREVQQARNRLEDLTSSKLAVENTTAPPQVIKHLPTPMAKTVFGEEEHFRLLGGRIVHVPMNTFVQRLEQEAKLKVYKLEDAPQVTEVIGPLGGFHMRYTLYRRKIAVPTSRGTAIREVADLESFVLLPTSAEMGEPLESALREGSVFREHLRRLDPNTTTITVWTYPDSFAEFRQVKAELFKLGFLTAGRPIPEGHPIGGSPHGSRSAAQ